MNSINNFFKRIKERPSIFFILLGLITAFSALEAYNPIIMKYGSFKHVFKENYIEKLSRWIVNAGEFISDGSTSIYYILFALLSLFLFSALSALFFSGYMNKLLKSVEGKPKSKGEFTKGISRNFLKLLLFIYSTVILTVLFYFMVIYSVIPVLLRVKQLTDGNAAVIFSVLLLGLLTALVVILALILYCMYFSYILPSIGGMKKGAVKAGIKMTNTYIWYLMPKTVLFMIGEATIRTVMFIIHYGHSSLAMSVITLAITAVLRTILYFVYLYFTFNTFVTMRADLYPEYEEAEIEEKNKVNQTVTVNQQNKENNMSVDKSTVIGHSMNNRNNTNTTNTIANSSGRVYSPTRKTRMVSKPLEEVKSPENIQKLEDDEYDDSFEV